MEDGDNCEICAAVYEAESRVLYKPVGRSNFRFQCEANNRDHIVHRYTIKGKLYRTMKGVRNSHSCPVCGHPSGVVGTPKTGAFCHVCDAGFLQRGRAIVLTALGKFREPPGWFVGDIEVKEGE